MTKKETIIFDDDAFEEGGFEDTLTITDQRDQTYLDEWIAYYRDYAREGASATYIPALAEADASQLGIVMARPDGTMLKAGDHDVPFTLQSISKVISFIQVCLDYGISEVLEKVDVEPTGDAFNSILRLELHKPGRPFNPMINAGALTVASMLCERTPEGKVSSTLDLLEAMLGKRPGINEQVFESEWETAHRNRAMAYYLKENGFLDCPVEDALNVYLKACSIEVHTEDIAKIGLILAYDGYDPVTDQRHFPIEVARLTKALMVTCGMYNASGKFAARVGLPSKSGVSGGIMTVVSERAGSRYSPVPHGGGIGVFGPAIDDYGNSIGGSLLLAQLAKDWDLNIF
ncbi:glutaminase [Salisediminibacterium selenitireducens]|uniref:Glutaminase n=1 Tax=Bacillus selenitireducens (strain ATCC 700615 / DSM 15326 / MLS10) TaxID=439292 RepID=D6XZS5_BACIE|nr:glutaminase [Salisediminibacterium selenitireducens]ADI00427.1 Glutaminase [[Bacillus] selenitireducens MLS10]